jgi:hypothetical protein
VKRKGKRGSDITMLRVLAKQVLWLSSEAAITSEILHRERRSNLKVPGAAKRRMQGMSDVVDKSAT